MLPQSLMLSAACKNISPSPPCLSGNALDAPLKVIYLLARHKAPLEGQEVRALCVIEPPVASSPIITVWHQNNATAQPKE